ncbi:hypothetical protein GSH08_04690 [Burkholderia pseudomallei]|nr:hypothetical protein [Burkholderia pseudomallei]MBM5583677.1 hypothetical protein [Burkholderia pseudomallei]RPA02432.1 hypothetical protein EGT86_35605 [Burkholderia pseudomallei]
MTGKGGAAANPRAATAIVVAASGSISPASRRTALSTMKTTANATARRRDGGTMKAPKEPIASGGAVLAGSVESPVWATSAGHLLHAADAAAVATFRLSGGSASRVRRVPAVPARRFGEAAGPRAPPKRRGAPPIVRTHSPSGYKYVYNNHSHLQNSIPA